jgi:hypothetical protein
MAPWRRVPDLVHDSRIVGTRDKTPVTPSHRRDVRSMRNAVCQADRFMVSIKFAFSGHRQKRGISVWLWRMRLWKGIAIACALSVPLWVLIY